MYIKRYEVCTSKSTYGYFDTFNQAIDCYLIHDKSVIYDCIKRRYVDLYMYADMIAAREKVTI